MKKIKQHRPSTSMMSNTFNYHIKQVILKQEEEQKAKKAKIKDYDEKMKIDNEKSKNRINDDMNLLSITEIMNLYKQ